MYAFLSLAGLIGLGLGVLGLIGGAALLLMSRRETATHHRPRAQRALLAGSVLLLIGINCLMILASLLVTSSVH